MLDWIYVVLAVYFVEGLFACFQCDCCVGAPERGPKCYSTDGSSLLSLSDSSGEHCCFYCDGLEFIVVQVGMHSERLNVILPFLP